MTRVLSVNLVISFIYKYEVEEVAYYLSFISSFVKLMCSGFINICF